MKSSPSKRRLTGLIHSRHARAQQPFPWIPTACQSCQGPHQIETAPVPEYKYKRQSGRLSRGKVMNCEHEMLICRNKSVIVSLPSALGKAKCLAQGSFVFTLKGDWDGAEQTVVGLIIILEPKLLLFQCSICQIQLPVQKRCPVFSVFEGTEYTLSEHFIRYLLELFLVCCGFDALCVHRCSSAYHCCNVWLFALLSPSCQLRSVWPFSSDLSR